MKFIVKDGAGKRVLLTTDAAKAKDRSRRPGYKLITVPVTR